MRYLFIVSTFERRRFWEGFTYYYWNDDYEKCIYETQRFRGL